MEKLRLLLTLSLASILGACSTTNVDMPKGTSGNYSSVRLVKPGSHPRPAPAFMEDSAEVNRMIQSALASQFQSNGLTISEDSADLVVAYMLIIQNNASTAAINDYFGYGRDSGAIMEKAHEVVVVDGKRPDYFKAGAIVIDLIDAKTNKLVYRNYAQRDMLDNPSDQVRRQRINEAVAEALGPFFR